MCVTNVMYMYYRTCEFESIHRFIFLGKRKEIWSGRVGAGEEGRERGMLASSGIKGFTVLVKNVCGSLFPNWNSHFWGLSLSIGYIGPPWKSSTKNPLL